MGKGARLGGAVAAAGGSLAVIGALLPWERLVIPPCGPAPGCFGPHGTPEIFLFYGWQTANGRVVMVAGAAMAIAGLLLTAYRAAGALCTISLAVLLPVAVVVAGAAAGAWWLRQTRGAVTAAGAVELSGVVLGLAALPLRVPGPAGKRVWLLMATVVLCGTGAALAWPRSAPLTIVF